MKKKVSSKTKILLLDAIFVLVIWHFKNQNHWWNNKKLPQEIGCKSLFTHLQHSVEIWKKKKKLICVNTLNNFCWRIQSKIDIPFWVTICLLCSINEEHKLILSLLKNFQNHRENRSILKILSFFIWLTFVCHCHFLVSSILLDKITECGKGA